MILGPTQLIGKNGGLVERLHRSTQPPHIREVRNIYILYIFLEVLHMVRKFDPMAGENKSFSWWWLGVKVGIITALIIWWWLDQKNRQQLGKIAGTGSLDEVGSIPLPDDASKVFDEASKVFGKAPEVSGKVPPKSEITKGAATAPSKRDDLRKIEGIGPKIQATLQTAGIETFSQLAARKPEDLKQILVNAGIRIGYPDTWPEQAALAAAGKWEKLDALQNSLKGGRR